MISAQDYGTFGGSSGAIGGRISQRASVLARERGLPLIILLDGGGHRIQDGLDSRHFANTGPLLHQPRRATSGWVPLVALVLGDGFAGNTNYAALADFVVMVRGVSTMGIAGPALVKASTGETITKEELGGAATQVDRNGIAHLGVDTEQEAFDAARRWLSYLPSNAERRASRSSHCDDPADRRDPELVDMVPANNRRAYESRRSCAPCSTSTASTRSSRPTPRTWSSPSPGSAATPSGIVANQPMVLAGDVSTPTPARSRPASSRCATPSACPLVFFVDIPGFLVGSVAEDSGLGRRSARIIFESARPPSPASRSCCARATASATWPWRRPQLRRRRRLGLADAPRSAP